MSPVQRVAEWAIEESIEAVSSFTPNRGAGMARLDDSATTAADFEEQETTMEFSSSIAHIADESPSPLEPLGSFTFVPGRSAPAGRSLDLSPPTGFGESEVDGPGTDTMRVASTHEDDTAPVPTPVVVPAAGLVDLEEDLATMETRI